MKINISVPDELMERADAYADANYMTRSGLLTMSLNNFLTQYEIVTALKRTSLALLKAAEKNEIDEATRKELDDFQKLCMMVSGADK